MKDKIIRLNENIESLIDVTHNTYMACTDEKEKVRLDGQIRAYWTVKGLVEDILQEDIPKKCEDCKWNNHGVRDCIPSECDRVIREPIKQDF